MAKTVRMEIRLEEQLATDFKSAAVKLGMNESQLARHILEYYLYPQTHLDIDGRYYQVLKHNKENMEKLMNYLKDKEEPPKWKNPNP